MPTQPKSKKSVVKTTLPVAKYHVGQKVYFMKWHKNKPEEVVEGEVSEVRTRDYDLHDGLGNKAGKARSFSYTVRTKLFPFDGSELELYSSFPEIAKVFTLHFTSLIK